MLYDLDDVFVSGGEPSVTYVSRDEADLEGTVERYLRVGGKVLTVSGPSKSGKTILIRKVLQEKDVPWINITGASLASVDHFWRIVAYRAGVPSTVESSAESTSQVATQGGGKIGGSGAPVEFSAQRTKTDADKSGSRSEISVELTEAVKERLKQGAICLVLDDFHYAPDEVRKSVAREVKSLIMDGVRVVLVAVPSRTMDLVQSEGELTGRVNRLQVREWNDIELLRIATKGYAALNVADAGGAIAAKLIEQSFGSPLLMQELCGELCRLNGVQASIEGEERALAAPEWAGFFGEVARNLRPALIDQLQLGPTERRRRVQRVMYNNDSVDMYSGVLLAVSRLSPKRIITLTELSDSLASFLKERPQLQAIRNTCNQMANIAQNNRGGDDPAIDFTTTPERLCVNDPYLAFYISWGLPDLDLPDWRYLPSTLG